jgi:hypothetical protein
MSENALRTRDIGVANLNPKEKAHRIASLKKVFAEAKLLREYAKKFHDSLARGPTPDFPRGSN